MGQRNDELLAEAAVSAPLLARRGQESVLLAKASGCRVFDADNVALIDLDGGGGTNLLGYANQYVLDAVRKALASGLAGGFHAVPEVELVDLLGGLLPRLSPWMLTGSEPEAWGVALRWCRQHTGRSRVVLFDANRRGASDAFAVSAAGEQGMAGADLAGVPLEHVRLIRVARWGDAEAFASLMSDIGVDVAAVVLDPLALHHGVWRPEPAFLTRVAEETRAAGAMLVVDETASGFRLARGGASEVFGLEPDLAVFGGALGGSVAQIGAVGWSSALAAAPADELPAPPPAMAVLASIATLSVLRNDAVHQRLEERGAQLQTGIEALAERFARPLRCQRVGSIFWCAFSKQPLAGPSAAGTVDATLWLRFVRGCRDAGLLLPARPTGAGFLCHAHGVKDIEQALAAMETSLRKMQREDEA